MNHIFARRVGVALFAVIFSLASFTNASASSSSTLTGTVTNDGKPVTGALVTARGNDSETHATTDAKGAYAFASLGTGTYDVSATFKALHAHAVVDLTGGGAALDLVLAEFKSIASVSIVRADPVRGSGADVSLNATVLRRSPTSDSFPETLIQLPGAARGANGVVHLNGDHGVIDYVVDGVALPQALNREVGSEIDPSDISFLDVVEGAYPAQYGLRFGSVLNVTTRSGSGKAGFDGEAHYGSFASVDQTLAYHSPLGNGGGYDVAVRNSRSDRELDPPDLDSPHDRGSDANQFARFTFAGKHDAFTDLTLIHSYRTFQIPNDVQNGEPATTDDNETQDDTFLNLQFRKPLGPKSSLSFGPALKISHIRDYGDPNGDFTYGQALNVLAAPYGNGGSPTDCASALSTGNYGPSTCAFSLADDKTAIDYIAQADYVARTGKHEIRAGLNYDVTRVAKTYDVALQPNNFLAPLVTPGTPNAATTVTDTNPNVGNTYQSYVQDAYRIDDRDQVDLGLRYDFFNIRSTNFAQGFGAFSPRLKYTRFFGPRASLYGYVGRFFEPFSFENVDPTAAQLLNLPLQPTAAQFDLHPERDTQIEFGGHAPIGAGSLGFRIWQKNANDLIDDTQVGVTALHQDINYTLGRLSAETLDYVLPLHDGGRVYANVNHTISVNSGCETQLLAPCFGSPTIYTPADHEQRWTLTGGALVNDAHGGWISGNFEYGSGLSSGICMPADDDCKATPHTIFAIEKGFALAKDVALTARIRNLFNDRYYVTLLNAQGTHDAPPRTLDVGVRFGK